MNFCTWKYRPARTWANLETQTSIKRNQKVQIANGPIKQMLFSIFWRFRVFQKEQFLIKNRGNLAFWRPWEVCSGDFLRFRSQHRRILRPTWANLSKHEPTWANLIQLEPLGPIQRGSWGSTLAHVGSCWGYVGSRSPQVGSKKAQDRSILAQVGLKMPKMASQDLHKANLARFLAKFCLFWTTLSLQNLKKKLSVL